MLQEIAREKKFSDTIIGLLIGVSQQTVTLWRKGKEQKFDFQTVERIRQVHSGALVPAREYFLLDKFLQKHIADSKFLKKTFEVLATYEKVSTEDESAALSRHLETDISAAQKQAVPSKKKAARNCKKTK